jgi:hypothetical protein
MQKRHGSKTIESWMNRAGGELSSAASKTSGPETQLSGVASSKQEGDTPRASFRKAMRGR